MTVTHGFTTPRVFTQPLAEGEPGPCGCGCALSPATSRGFECIAFAENVLRVRLYPWQRWLLIHLLETNPDGTLRFRKAVVIVARQNGKTLVAAILAAFFLYVDSVRWADIINPRDFVVVGAAQKLDIAMKPWSQVRRWGGPDDPRIGIAYDRVPLLQAATRMPRTSNGETELVTQEGAVYRPRTFEGARGYSSARLILDELRQQYDYEGWSAIEKSATAMFDSMLLTFSNAGTLRSVVLRDIRDIAHESVDNPAAQWFIAEWSAEPTALLDEPEAFAQANPSAGYNPAMTIAGLMQTAAEARNKNLERIEVLCQWVDGAQEGPFPSGAWEAGVDPSSQIADGSRVVYAVDTSIDRTMTYIAAAGFREDGVPHVELVAARAGTDWPVGWFSDPEWLAQNGGRFLVAGQTKGAPVSPLLEDLAALEGVEVADWSGQELGAGTARLYDLVAASAVTVAEDGRATREGLAHLPQPALDIAAATAVPKMLTDGGIAWDRKKSPTDIAPLVAATGALWLLLRREEIAVSAYESRGVLTV